MNTKLISVTPDAEKTIAYCARVSSSKQDNPNYSDLLKYCIKNGHWSIFEMANMSVEITTSRAIAAQILRHRSFTFQEFSQRYAEALSAEVHQARSQDVKNRQNSIDDVSADVAAEWRQRQRDHYQDAFDHYDWAIEKGIAKECARMILPLSTETRLYMNGTVRSWIHYLHSRTDPSTQFEHREIAESIRLTFVEQFPFTAKALGWL